MYLVELNASGRVMLVIWTGSASYDVRLRKPVSIVTSDG
jgi:hypothetical protein